MLELNKVNAFYGKIRALHDVSLEVPEGKIVSLLGANGAGKSTTLRTIVGLNRSANNDIRFCGRPLGNVAPYRIVTEGIALVPERREVFPGLSVADNLELGAYRRSDHAAIKQDIDRIYAMFPVLAKLRNSRGADLSGGQQQMLAIGRALMSRPKLLLLDEPTLGLSPLLVQQIFATLVTLNKEGVTILLVEQNAQLAFSISSYAYILENGRVTLENSTEVLRADPAVKAAYLGAI
jgi:branched-chain amino acid transport system ATP-binding protein